MTQLTPSHSSFIPLPVLKVLGLGGGGCNAINRMIELGIGGVEFIAANTDHQALQASLAQTKILLGPHVTRGLGAGGKPEVGQAAAEESERELAKALEGADMVFLTAGMGGGTGTGSIPIAARAARSIGAVTIAIVTTPFSFEMGRRQRNAAEGLANLRPHTDTLIAIPNDRLLYVAPRNLPLEVAFRLADDVLRQAVQGITELITEPGLINVDFAHIRRLMKLGGGALMSIGQGHGEGKARCAFEQALHHPLLDSVSIDQAAGIIANFTGGEELSLLEVSEVLTEIHNQIGSQVEIVLGVTHDERMSDRAQVILVITGLGAPSLETVMPGFAIQQVKPTVLQDQTTTMSQSNPSIVAHPVDNLPLNLAHTASNDLDLPAFLRRRARLAN
ncbi:MAG: cell division protein FtsZ [Chloroflexi bacterium RBG_19FT_COMBO_56_12]|nr:MAG: cell division protein FtsZ [Chloroflexi bacterium RBG_19FT_COMBO_56_12]